MSAYHAKKRLGQNFLKSADIIRQIVVLIDPGEGQRIVEIGPGRGALSLPIAESGARLWAIEFDRDQIGYLERLLRKFDNARVLNTDFLAFEPTAEHLPDFKLVGNLPFNITSPVVDWCCSHSRHIQYAVFMVQKEVAARLSASPGNKNWSPLSIMVQLQFEVEYCFDVPSEAFHPPPKVDGAVIKLTPLEDTIAATPEFERVVRTSFRHRRKFLTNNLVPDIIPETELAVEILETILLSRNCRAEQITIEQFFTLTEELDRRKLL
ncbi:MAG: ribosomal RNA small subunit methyltransferase A [Candidatus Zixiibacteriota bacterium]|nr:MAG: ribosomal RNA small subunit methyltransferase A [candidate division Zixibacteria bacterium]